MIDKIQALKAEIDAFVLKSAQDLEEYKRKITGRNGRLNDLFEAFKNLDRTEKAGVGKFLNEIKQLAMEKQAAVQDALPTKKSAEIPDDLTLPGDAWNAGSRHPLSLVQNRIIRILEGIGFSIADGPEIDDDWHNFSALNIPDDHPARDMQDTFFISTNPAILLRTHTSNVQVHVMTSRKPPIRIMVPGRVYRNETVSARAHCFFHQIEGLYIDEGVTFPDLLHVLDHFAKSMFGEKTRIRLRPSYFPFTEISAEMDVTCRVCNGAGCSLCKHTGWVEIMGCGMVDPQVMLNCGIDPERYSGFAFGMGVERIAQLLYRVPDLRLYSQNDIRFLQQFQKIH